MRVPPKHIIWSSIWSLSISGFLSKRHVQDLDGRYSMAVHFLFSLHVLAQLFIVISFCIVDIHEEPTTFPPLKSNPCGHRASKIVGQAQGTLILIKNKYSIFQIWNIKGKKYILHKGFFPLHLFEEILIPSTSLISFLVGLQNRLFFAFLPASKMYPGSHEYLAT